MAERYDHSVRDAARRLWLMGGMTDAQIAEQVGVQRADTIRDFRRAGDWESLREVIRTGIDAELIARQAKRLEGMNAKHDQLGEAIESLVVKQLKSRGPNGESNLSAADIRSLAGALLNAQRLRRIALGADIEAEAGSTKTFIPPIIMYHAIDPEKVRAERQAAETAATEVVQPPVEG